MAIRRTDTSIWDEDWFVSMRDDYKILFMYIKDRCDMSGVWKPNILSMRHIVSSDLRLNGFLTAVNKDKERIKVLKNGRWFLPGFFAFQYSTTFKTSSAVHLAVLKTQLEHGISPYDNSYVCFPDLNAYLLFDKGALATKQLRDLHDFICPRLGAMLGASLIDIYSSSREVDSGTLESKGRSSREEVFTLEEEVIQDTSEKKNESDEILENLPPLEPSPDPKPANPNPAFAYSAPPPTPTSQNRKIDLDTSPGWSPSFDMSKPVSPRPKEYVGDMKFPWTDDEFKKQWDLWKDHLWQQHGGNSTKYPYRGIMAQQQALINLSNICQGNRELAIRTIQNSIGCGYVSLHKPKEDGKSKSQSRTSGAGTGGDVDLDSAFAIIDAMYIQPVREEGKQ